MSFVRKFVGIVQGVLANGDPEALQLDSSGNLLVNVASGGGANLSVGVTGATAPTSATEIGIVNNSGNLTNVSSTTPLRIDPVGTTAQPVTGTFFQATQPVSGTVTANAGTGNFTVVQATGTNLHAVLDTTSTTAVTQPTAANLNATVVGTGTFAVQATGTLTDNNAAPSTNNMGVLPAVANYKNPVKANGDLGTLSCDLQGNQRVSVLQSTVLGDLVASDRYNQIEVNFSQAFNAALLTNSVVTTGTAVQGSGCATYSTGTGAAGEAKGVTTQSLEYRPGHEWYAYFTAAFTTGVSSSFQRIGPYSTTDGFYIGWEGTVFNLTQLQNSVATHTARASWNGDAATGSAGSAFTSAGSPVALDFTKLNIYRIHGAWFGTAPILLDVFSPDGLWVTLHTYRFPNTLTTPYAFSTNWNMTVDVANTGNTTNLALVTACWAMGTTDANNILTDQVTDQSLASLSRSVIVGKTPAGTYGNVNTTAQNALTVGGSGATSVAAAAWTNATAGNTALTMVSNSFSYNSVAVQIVGTSTITGGVVSFEVSIDNTNWIGILGVNTASGAPMATNTYTLTVGTAGFVFNIAGYNYFRQRLSTVITGTGNITTSYNLQGLATANTTITTGTVHVSSDQGTPNSTGNAWPMEITDATHGPVAVKAASTAAVAADPALVVAISPNNTTSSTASSPASTSVTSTSASILASNTSRKEVMIVNTGTVVVYLGLGQVPTSSAYHVALSACTSANDGTGGSYISDLWTGAINGITASTSGTVCVAELT